MFTKIFRENLHSVSNSSFIVCAFITDAPKYRLYGDRLVSSCEKYYMPYSIYLVPCVHKSISPSGRDDEELTKAYFIRFNLDRFPDSNVLYLDADMFFMDYPSDIVRASRSGYDFAIYNWLNDEHNEAYVPLNMKLESGNRYSDYYVFSHSIKVFSSDQLICSGGVQFFRNSPVAKMLLEHWKSFVVRHPGYADDECLDYVYNNFIAESCGLKAFWLNKAYIRFPWWPHVKPVIIHPGLPAEGSGRHIEVLEKKPRFYPEKCRHNPGELLFPRDYVIDTKERLLLKVVNNRVVDSSPIPQEFWIYPEDVGMDLRNS